jgi:hypothetical protein
MVIAIEIELYSTHKDIDLMAMIMIIGGVALVQLSQSSSSGSKEVKADSLAGVVSVLLGKSDYDKINIIAFSPILVVLICLS